MAKTGKPEKTEKPSFEKALAELEHIVDKLEKGGLSLNESLALFEKGVKSARFLRDELDQAEKKVEILLKDEKGGRKARPFKGGEGEEPEDEDEAPGENEDEESEGEEEPGDPDKEGGKLPF